jgi:hypothetical protein
MMGVALPDLPPVNLEHNINLGDKDSVRRRALWALEGKSGADNFSTVEIPELSAPEIERRMFELRECSFVHHSCSGVRIVRLDNRSR